MFGMLHPTSGRNGTFVDPFNPPSSHAGIVCNGCNAQPIQGVRYKCMMCPDFDLCEECIKPAVRRHDAAHLFLRIDKPTDGVNYPMVANRSALRHEARCGFCAVQPIVGFRYQCALCMVDLCEACEFKGVHDSTHPRMKIAMPTPAPAPAQLAVVCHGP